MGMFIRRVIDKGPQIETKSVVFLTVMDLIQNVKFDNLYIYWNATSANYAIDSYNV